MGVGDVGMNSTECSALRDQVEWLEPGKACLLSLLAAVDLMVILGNCLVIAAVFLSSKLRSVTNLFIVSLAVADLMVGLAVLPFSAVWEVFEVWIFGDLWCSAWLALDVWMCTASILNLCAISLDRYVAVTRPVTYPSIMSTGRAKILIAAVWVLSFLICFPPLIDWKGKEEGPAVPEGPGRPLTPGGATVVTSFDAVPTTPEPPCPWRCELTNDTGYVIYSALGSFYIPMFVMLFFYWRIYRAAIQTTRAINQGFRTTKTARGGIGSRFDDQRLTLRIHRGRGSVMQGSTGSNSTTTTNSAANSVTNSPGGQNTKSPDRRHSRKERKHEKIKISVSYPSSDHISANNNSPPPSSPKSSISSSSPTSTGALYAVQYTGNEPSSVFRKENCHLRVASLNNHRRGRRSNSDCGTERSNSVRPKLLGDPLSVTIQKDLSPSPSYEESKPKLISRMGKRNIKAQVKRFRMETKAAKTLGIIVGGFIVCWLPFFTMYLVRAFMGDIHPMVFSVLFWLGYCNSAINPCIYALFSKDFRFAFKRIICRCLCSRDSGHRNSSKYMRRGSDGSHLNLRRGERRSASLDHNELSTHQHHSDSDPNNEPGSESR
ncbi:octopamine receptor [Nesidiocoris tenuis]|uniref:Octopamine receptor n=1 Tax=Nesidiocoris tenuis TaxID=355587 RepID=A0ABN7AY66_9HEMI|nr:octopamine receptor [Nesidiocoris tenuis]